MQTETESPQVVELAGGLQRALSNVFAVLRRVGPPVLGSELTMAQLSILLTLLDHGPMRMTELAARERVRTPTVTVAVRRMEKAGRVTRADDPYDGRAVVVDITPQGRNEHRVALEGRCAALSQLLNRLQNDERESLARALGPLQLLVENAEPS
ncbi:MarR family transcriptional regulator [soil metagenome]